VTPDGQPSKQVVSANDPEEIAVTQIDYSKVFLPPSAPPLPQEFRLLKQGWEADFVRIA
jgi:hypothetical protein